MKERILYLLIQQKKFRDSDYSQAKLAADVGTSTYTLSKVLRKIFGMTYTDIVHKYRIREAMRQLKNPRKQDYTVDEIGMLVGFGNRQSFFSAFKKVTGTTPERFRVMHNS